MATPARKRDRRLPALILALGFIALCGTVIGLLPGDWSLTTVDKEDVTVPATSLDPPHGTDDFEPSRPPLPDASRWVLAETGPTGPEDAGQHAVRAREEQVDILFQHGVSLFRQGDATRAVTLFDQVLGLRPDMTEAYVNRGYARLVLGQREAALEDFHRAINLYPSQANAYYGAAQAYEALGDLEAALGAMRAFIHLSREDSVFITRARAAIWEWGEQLRQQRERAAAEAAPAPLG